MSKRRYHARKAEGSCQNCGAEAQKGKTRCLPCGQLHATNYRKKYYAARRQRMRAA